MQNFFSISFVPISVRVFIFYLLVCYFLDLLLYFLKYQYSTYLYDKESHPVIYAKKKLLQVLFFFLPLNSHVFCSTEFFQNVYAVKSHIIFFHSHNNSVRFICLHGL